MFAQTAVGGPKQQQQQLQQQQRGGGWVVGQVAKGPAGKWQLVSAGRQDPIGWAPVKLQRARLKRETPTWTGFACWHQAGLETSESATTETAQ